MQIIAELEDSPRGPYCGAVGFLSPPGADAPAARFNVPIRTVVLDAETRTAEYGVGGGITWDSSAQGEYDETVAKARVLTARRPRFELYETLRHDPGEGFRHLDRHLARLRASSAYFAFELDEAAVDRGADEGRGARRPTGRRGSASPSTGRDGPTPGRPRSCRRPDPCRVAIDRDHPVDPADPMLFHKHSLRDVYERARARHPDADDVLLVNDRGEVTESTIANVAIRLAGRWVTPPLDSGLLPGHRPRGRARGGMARGGADPRRGPRRGRRDRARQRRPRTAPR